MTSGQKWFAIAGVILIALVIIGAVSNSLEPESKTMAQPTTTTYQVPVTTTTQPATTTTTQPATTSTYASWIADETFVSVMRDTSYGLELVTWVDLVDDDYLIEWGHLFCFQMDEHDGVWEDAALYALNAGIEAFGDAWNNDDSLMIGAGSGAAIAAYCPWYEVPDENPWG